MLEGVHEMRVTSTSADSDGRPLPFPIQVDGDYIGEHSRVDIRVEPGALTVVA
jgi:diacylglycerol kinase family enzyme